MLRAMMPARRVALEHARRAVDVVTLQQDAGEVRRSERAHHAARAVAQREFGRLERGVEVADSIEPLRQLQARFVVSWIVSNHAMSVNFYASLPLSFSRAILDAINLIAMALLKHNPLQSP